MRAPVWIDLFRQRGLSLVEIAMVLAISGVFVFFLGNLLLNAAPAYYRTTDILEARAQLRVAMDRIARELREVGVTYTASTAPPTYTPPAYRITSPASPGSANSITFVKNDGATTVTIAASGSVANITYSPGATGKLADIDSTAPLTFTFNDRTTNPSTPAGPGAAASYSIYDLGSIAFTLTVKVNGVTATGNTRVALRTTAP